MYQGYSKVANWRGSTCVLWMFISTTTCFCCCMKSLQLADIFRCCVCIDMVHAASGVAHQVVLCRTLLSGSWDPRRLLYDTFNPARYLENGKVSAHSH